MDENKLKLAIEARISGAQGEFSGFRIVAKERSVLMWSVYIVTMMWIWNRDFMGKFVTTIGSVVYVPGGEFSPTIESYALLNHELQHIQDSRKFGMPIWAFLYLFPQSLAPLALFAFWWPPAAIALVCLAPWPAPFRVWAEARGYEEGLKTMVDWGLRPRVDWLEGVFTGWHYWRMAWRWEPLRKRFVKVATGE